MVHRNGDIFVVHRVPSRRDENGVLFNFYVEYFNRVVCSVEYDVCCGEFI